MFVLYTQGAQGRSVIASAYYDFGSDLRPQASPKPQPSSAAPPRGAFNGRYINR